MRCFIKKLTVLLALGAAVLLLASVYIYYQIPKYYYVTEGSNLKLNNFSALEVLGQQTGNYLENVNYSEDTSSGQYESTVSLWGVVPIKSVEVKVIGEQDVVICGTPFGLKMFTKGVIVVGTSSLQTEKGEVFLAQEAGIQKGDIILSVNGKELVTNEGLMKDVAESEGKALELEISRNDEILNISIAPLKCIDQTYKIGVWVRDSSAGIGTMTFYDPNSNMFAGLGHAICDVDTGEILPLYSGEIANVVITGVTKSAKGAPGEIKGYFDQKPDTGSLMLNNETGVYGVLYRDQASEYNMPIAMKQEVVDGKAQIIATIGDDGPQLYDVEVERVNLNSDTPTKNMIIKVTDERLLSVTGGIVQGMSGSPIIQNGKLIGAVTHVFVNDPQKGYGIFSENMITNFDIIKENILNKAS